MIVATGAFRRDPDACARQDVGKICPRLGEKLRQADPGHSLSRTERTPGGPGERRRANSGMRAKVNPEDASGNAPISVATGGDAHIPMESCRPTCCAAREAASGRKVE